MAHIFFIHEVMIDRRVLVAFCVLLTVLLLRACRGKAAGTLSYLENAFPPEVFESVRDQVLEVVRTETKRNSTVFLRTGGAIETDIVVQKCPVLSLVHSDPAFVDSVAAMASLNRPIRPTSVSDKASVNVLVYQSEGDHIEWHVDNNHLNGERLTVLWCLVNRSDADADRLSSATLMYIDPATGEVKSLRMKPNSLLVFTGDSILHKATPMGPNETRILASFTYCDVCTPHPVKDIFRRIKEAVMY